MTTDDMPRQHPEPPRHQAVTFAPLAESDPISKDIGFLTIGCKIEDTGTVISEEVRVMDDVRSALLLRYKQALLACGYPNHLVESQLEIGKTIDVEVLREYVKRAESRVPKR